jgi:purine-binding chemotaxis protein CheW
VPAREIAAAAPAEARVQLCTFRVGGEDCAVDIMRVREIIPPLPLTPVPRAPPFVEGVLRLRGEVIPVVDVRRRLGLEVTPATRRSRYVIVNVARRRLGLVVDEVCEVVRIRRDELRPAPALAGARGPRFFLGVCGGEAAPAARRGGAGRLRLLLDVKALLDPAVPGEAEDARAQAAAARAEAQVCEAPLTAAPADRSARRDRAKDEASASR